MPLYEYQCDACGSRFERIRKFSDPPIELCPNCGELKVRKLLSSPAIQFKGSGFYITDYARKGAGSPDGAKTDAPAKASDGDGKAAPSESKSEGKSDKTSSSDSKTSDSGSTSKSSGSTGSGPSTSSKDS
jgi:putative FmdB family regulatory protein